MQESEFIILFAVDSVPDEKTVQQTWLEPVFDNRFVVSMGDSAEPYIVHSAPPIRLLYPGLPFG